MALERKLRRFWRWVKGEKPVERTCVRKVEFDAAHRVRQHESKCRNLHGHRYVVEITARAQDLDDLGRVVDFSVLKSICGTWLDEYWDHGLVAHIDDQELINFCADNGWKTYAMPNNPTAENMAEYLLNKFNELMKDHPLRISHIRVYETPNCWADYGEK